jgi:hypothetical protein
MQFNQRISNVGYDWDPMSNPTGPVSDAGVVSLDNNPMNSARWVQQAARFTNFGLAPQESTVPEFQSNQSIVYTRTIYPWINDNTHLQMQEGMLVFVASYNDPKCKIYCSAPIYKLNILMEDQFNEQTIPGSESPFYTNTLRNEGEQRIRAKRELQNYGINKDADYSFEEYAKDENCYMTKLGIQGRWMFDGAVVTKSESTGPFVEADHHESTDMVTSMGVIVCQQARVHNIWGKVRPGHRLYLILTRKRLASGGYGTFWYKPWFSNKNEYPSEFYLDDAGNMCTPTVYYIGLCTEVKERDPTEDMMHAAIGLYRSTQDAYRAYGSLPCIQIQIRV